MSTEKDWEAAEKCLAKHHDKNGCGDGYSYEYCCKIFCLGIQHARQGERERLKRFALYCYNNMSIYLSRNDDDNSFIDEFLEQEKSK